MDRQASKRQRERYRVLIEDVADGFFETDLKGNFIFFNQSFCNILGHSKEELNQVNVRMITENPEFQQITDTFGTLFKIDDETKLFDSSFKREGVDKMLKSGEIEFVFISHEHLDHLWGLQTILKYNP